jgi:molecular chaperone Hsp33
MTDTLHRFLIRPAAVRGEVITLTESWREIVARHPIPPPVRDRLGELCAAALLLAATIQFDGLVILQIHGDGPVAIYVVECARNGHFRATVQLRDSVDPQSPMAPDTPLSALVNANGRGRFVVTLEPLDRTQPVTQGIVPFEGESVAEVLENYMARSEQVPTRIWLAANDTQVGGLLLQRLPTEGGKPAPDLDGWGRLQLLGETVTPSELCTLAPEQLLHRLFWQEASNDHEQRAVRFACRCSRERVADMLRMLGPEEIASILTERPDVEVRCEFCNQPYAFDAVDCAQLFRPESAPDELSAAIRH